MFKRYTNTMKSNKQFIYILIIFFIVSVNSIYSFTSFLTKDTYSLVLRQSIFYTLGIFCILLMLKINPKVLLNYSFYIYIINTILLVLVLFIGSEVNGAKAWFSIPVIGTFQPSEFMKIGLILFLARVIDEQKLKTWKDEIVLIVKVLIITLIPSFITFLEPDTGAVLIYFIIALSMLFVSKIRLRWFMFLFSGTVLSVSIVFYLYIVKTDFFINLFGSSMFYRFDRIFDWRNSSGMQLQNSLISIGSSGLLGKGINNILLYFPEGHTDFIFASFASIYGLIGMLILIATILWFDVVIIKTKTDNSIYKYVISGVIGALLYQQIQNISMTIGLMPITGITLPFISYGGSSLISYMILLGIVMSIRKSKIKKPNMVFYL
ncbi:MAG: FtsW/RodA/SpoVE family cell cycle protein [Bacilli bacterium]|nr:FtsW/RodA/SpoVE family cell cycle protein [Bacilli bacterium]